MASAATWRDKRQDVHALPDPKVMTELFQTALSELTASLAQLEGVRAKYQTYVEWETRMNSQRPLSEVYEETKYRLTECNKRLEEAKLSMDWIFSRKKT